MADPLYRFNPAAERYIAPSGQFVSRAAVRATLDVVLESQMSRISARSADLVAGNVDLATWRAEVAQAAKIAHLEGAAVARGGWSQLTQDDYEWVGRERIRPQLTYLQRFHDDLLTGQAPMDGTVASRAEMYVEAGRGTQREMERRMAVARGVDQEKNVLGSERPCSDCVAASGQGWVPVGTLPPIGGRQCLSRDHCHLNFR